MMRRLLIIGMLMLNFFSMANAVEILRWDRIPLALPLIVGQERIVLSTKMFEWVCPEFG